MIGEGKGGKYHGENCDGMDEHQSLYQRSLRTLKDLTDTTTELFNSEQFCAPATLYISLANHVSFIFFSHSVEADIKLD